MNTETVTIKGYEESGLINEATATVNAIRREKLSKHTERLRQLIKSGVCLQYRPALNLQGA